MQFLINNIVKYIPKYDDSAIIPQRMIYVYKSFMSASKKVNFTYPGQYDCLSDQINVSL